jgi:hypothetical protein
MAEGDGLPAVSGGGRGKYVTWSPELETAILERVAAGESVLAVCRGDGMPHPTTVYAWGRERPEFAVALAEAQRTARVAIRLAERAAAAAKLAAGRDNRGRWSTYTPELGEEICARISGGESLAAVGRDPEMPTAATILRWAREFPDFGDRYTLARLQMADWLFDEAREVSLEATPATVWVGRLRFDTIRWMTARMAPKKYCERLVIDAGIAERRAEEDDEGRGPMTVIVKRFTDVTAQDEAEADATEARAWAREARRGRG